MAFNEEKYKRLKQLQADKEEELITGNKRLFGIYQLKSDLDNIRDLAFQGTKSLEKYGKEIDADNYELLYVDSLDGANLEMKGSVLEDIFHRFNMERPEDYVGHSLSVSDVVVFSYDGELEAFFCDSFGFSEEPEFAEKLIEKYEEIKEVRAERYELIDTLIEDWEKWHGSYLPADQISELYHMADDKEDIPSISILQRIGEEYIDNYSNKINAQPTRTVVLTGLPVSTQLQSIIDKCAMGKYVSLDEIRNTPEMKAAYSCISHQTPTIQLKDREDIEDHVFNVLSEYGSVSIDEKGNPLVDSDGNTLYNNSVDQGNRLDIVIGLPASGKSSAIVDTISHEHNSMLIDNDEAKRLFPEFNKGWGADTVHAESKIVEQRVFYDALDQGKNIVLPKVGSSSEQLLNDYILPAKDKGYKVNVHFVDLDRNKALARMLNRFIEKGRFLAPELIDKYANERDGNRIEKAFNELSRSIYVDGISKWDNDVAKGAKPKLKEVRGLADDFITDLYDTKMTNREIADTISSFFKEYGTEYIAGSDDIYSMLEDQIDLHLDSYILEEPEPYNDVDYLKVLRARMGDNLKDIDELVEDIDKVMRVNNLTRKDLSEDMQQALLDFEVGAVLQRQDYVFMDASVDEAIEYRKSLVENEEIEEKGGQEHGEQDEISGDVKGSTSELRFSDNGGEDGRSDEQGEHGDKTEGGGVQEPVERGSGQAQERDNAQVHGQHDVEAFKDNIFVQLTGHHLDGTVVDDVKSLRYDFEDIINTINEDREKYDSVTEGVVLSTIYGDVTLSSVTRDEFDRFALQNDYYIGKLFINNGLLNEGQTIAFNKYEILGVGIPDPDILMGENTSLVNPAYYEMLDELEISHRKDDITFTCYQAGDKQGYEVTFFKDEDVSRFYVTDTDEYGIAKGVGIISEDFMFNEGMALMVLQQMNMGFDNLDNCIAFRLHDKEMTERLIEQSRETSLPAELTMSVVDDGNAIVESTLSFCDERTAEIYSENVRNELLKYAEISGVDRHIQTDIHSTSYKAMTEQKEKQENDEVKESYEKQSPEEELIEKFRAKTDDLFHEIDDYTPREIEEMVMSHVKDILTTYNMNVEAVDVVVAGSRCRGIEHDGSDLDVVVEIHGDEREDVLSDTLNAEHLYIGGVKVDINPIMPQDTGTLAEYLPKVDKYLEEKAKDMEQGIDEKQNEDVSLQDSKEDKDYKPLAKVEETEEQNYNMIDNVINNVEPKEEKEKRKHEFITPAGSKYADFKIRKHLDNDKYDLIATVKLREGDIKNNQVIGTFDDRDKAVDFCKKNNVAFEDITNHLQQRIEHKKQKANDKEQGSQPPDPKKNHNKGAGIDD